MKLEKGEMNEYKIQLFCEELDRKINFGSEVLYIYLDDYFDKYEVTTEDKALIILNILGYDLWGNDFHIMPNKKLAQYIAEKAQEKKEEDDEKWSFLESLSDEELRAELLRRNK